MSNNNFKGQCTKSAFLGIVPKDASFSYINFCSNDTASKTASTTASTTASNAKNTIIDTVPIWASTDGTLKQQQSIELATFNGPVTAGLASSGTCLFGANTGPSIVDNTTTNMTGFGIGSLTAATGTADNTAVGNNSLNKTTGSQNTGLGSKSGDVVTTGSNNTYLGCLADTFDPTDNHSVAVGFSSKTATNSVAIGSNSFVSGSNSCSIGFSAATLVDDTVNIGSGSAATGLGSTVIGKSASDGGKANCIVLGSGALATAADQLVLSTRPVTDVGVAPAHWISIRIGSTDYKLLLGT